MSQAHKPISIQTFVSQTAVKTFGKGRVFEFSPEQCHSCELRPLYNKAKGGRAVYISYYEPLFAEMENGLSSQAGKQAYK